MAIQDFLALACVALAAGYLLYRYLRRRRSGNCCGEPECPAARNVLRKLR